MITPKKTGHGGRRPGAGKRLKPRPAKAHLCVDLNVKLACDHRFDVAGVLATHRNAKGPTSEALRQFAIGALCANRRADIETVVALLGAIDTTNHTTAALDSLRERLTASLVG